VGIVVALTIVFVPPVADLFAGLRQLESGIGIALLPALTAIAAGLFAYRLRQSQQNQTQALVADSVKRELSRRTTETERLVAFGHAVARALDLDAMRAAVGQHLSRVTGSSQAWVLIRQGPGWELLAGVPAADTDAIRQREEFAEAILKGDRTGVTRDPRAGFPLVVGDAAIGVIGIEAAGTITEERARIIEAAASLLAVCLRNVQVFRDIKETGVRDRLTGCWTRSHAMEVIDAELRRARRSGLAVSILLFDLDHFKSINDRYGHLAGDAVLAEVGKRFQQVLRTSDLKARYGGEEFIGVLPATPLQGAGCVAETLRREIAGRPVPWNDAALNVTASIGVTQAEAGELDIEAIIARADAALYRAKQQGRNRVCFEPDAPPPVTIRQEQPVSNEFFAPDETEPVADGQARRPDSSPGRG
jgi:diguanylate cyclase (GGDEF)-like protein